MRLCSWITVNVYWTPIKPVVPCVTEPPQKTLIWSGKEGSIVITKTEQVTPKTCITLSLSITNCCAVTLYWNWTSWIIFHVSLFVLEATQPDKQPPNTAVFCMNALTYCTTSEAWWLGKHSRRFDAGDGSLHGFNVTLNIIVPNLNCFCYTAIIWQGGGATMAPRSQHDRKMMWLTFL